MTFVLYLAMTAGEIAAATDLPDKLCYMACHFSAYGAGLSNIPAELPDGSVLILNDRMSIQAHDPELVSRQLKEVAEQLDAQAVLLDLQRPACLRTAQIVQAITQTTDRPVAVSEVYAAGLSCPVFLPPPPINCPLTEYLTPWKDRPIWLEVSLDAQQITLTEKGSESCLLPRWAAPEEGHQDTHLHCHYRIELTDDQASFTLWRTAEDLSSWLKEAACLGVECGIGLYQELGTIISQL